MMVQACNHWPFSGTFQPGPGFVAPMQAILVDSIRPGDWIY
jgi:hypothetical protein